MQKIKTFEMQSVSGGEFTCECPFKTNPTIPAEQVACKKICNELSRSTDCFSSWSNLGTCVVRQFLPSIVSGVGIFVTVLGMISFVKKMR